MRMMLSVDEDVHGQYGQIGKDEGSGGAVLGSSGCLQLLCLSEQWGNPEAVAPSDWHVKVTMHKIHPSPPSFQPYPPPP